MYLPFLIHIFWRHTCFFDVLSVKMRVIIKTGIGACLKERLTLRMQFAYKKYAFMIDILTQCVSRIFLEQLTEVVFIYKEFFGKEVKCYCFRKVFVYVHNYVAYSFVF